MVCADWPTASAEFSVGYLPPMQLEDHRRATEKRVCDMCFFTGFVSSSGAACCLDGADRCARAAG